MMDLEMTFQLARDLMAADSVEMIQRETIKFIESRLGQPAAIAVRESSGYYRVVASEDLEADSVTERLQSCVNGLPRFEYLSNNRGGVANFQPDSTTIVSQTGPEPDLLVRMQQGNGLSSCRLPVRTKASPPALAYLP